MMSQHPPRLQNKTPIWCDVKKKDYHEEQEPLDKKIWYWHLVPYLLERQMHHVPMEIIEKREMVAGKSLTLRQKKTFVDG
jgi:hypothetical protein